ncbi:hypothetical protein O3P69_011886 [Scylla paramamosain]|uniref:MATH domain-containing protein n=1 Tax=Scylla paramamosain TaxID=85552 RepID=A0AAW0SA75_SCYPA
MTTGHTTTAERVRQCNRAFLINTMADETAPLTTAPINHPINHSPINNPINHSLINNPINHSPINRSPINHSPINLPINHSPINLPINHSPINLPINHSPHQQQPHQPQPHQPQPHQPQPHQAQIHQPHPISHSPINHSPINLPINHSPINHSSINHSSINHSPINHSPITTAGLSEEASSNTKEEDKTKRETDKREPKNEETQRLQRSEKTVDGAKRRGYPKKKPHGAGVKREATPSVSVTDKLSLEATFQFHVKNFSKVNMPLWSAPCWLHGMPWMIRAGPITVPFNENEKKEKKFLSVGLRCEGVWGAAFWACYGIADFSLLPVNRKQAPHVVGIECLFQKNVRLGIVNQFMLWENVLNPHHGYIEDDAVTFKVRLRTAPPYVINWSSDRLVRAPTQTLAVPPPHVTSGRKDEDCNSDVNENDSDDDSDDKDYNDEDSDDEDMNKTLQYLQQIPS